MLLADRFLSLNGHAIDLASGEAVRFDRLPPADRTDHLAWNERCAGLSQADATSALTLVDYGLLEDGNRFEAWQVAFSGTRAKGGSRRTSLECVRAESGVEDLIARASDLFGTAKLGEPRCLRWSVTPDARSTTMALNLVARHARLNGFVPLSVDMLVNAERQRTALRAPLVEVVETRHLLLMARAPIACTRRGWCSRTGRPVCTCPFGLARLVLAVGIKSARPNLILLAQPADATRGVVAPAACLGTNPLRMSRHLSRLAAEAHEKYQLAGGPDLVRLRARAAEAIAQARDGRVANAEHGLREAMSALARREDVTAAAWVAVNLGCLLLERGRALDAARTFEAARAQFDRANDLTGATRAVIYLGLAWTDEGRLAEGEAACRSARLAAHEAGLGDLAIEAGAALARCLYWQGRFDEATVLASSLSDVVDPACPGSGDGAYPREAGERAFAVVREGQALESWEPRPPALNRRTIALPESDRRVRIAALAARLALVGGDLRSASVHGAHALEAALRTARPLDVCVAQTALAAVRGAMNDVDGLLAHVREGLLAARRAHAPLRALRLRLIASDSLRLAGREHDAAKWARHLAGLDAARFPGLLRTRLHVVVAGQNGTAVRVPGVAAMPARLAAASCPWRLASKRVDVAEEIAAVLQVCHEFEDEEAALRRVCEAVRDRTHSVAVSIVGRDSGAAAVLARAGLPAASSAIADRVLDTGLAIGGLATPLGLEAGSPVRYAGAVIGAIVSRWPAETLLEAARVTCLLSAASAAVAPHVRTVLDRRVAPRAGANGSDVDLVGVSEAMETLRRAAMRAARAPFPVLIGGESGSGKELVARAIHRNSARRARKLCALNCAALTDDLLEAELFGHARGAFTGAVAERVGLFEEADGGTLFLDEVADLSPRAQAKLLRVLQDGEVRRVGENFARHVDARVIAATNRQLDAEVSGGHFRHDLFYRLNVIHIEVPPLRDRPEDIRVLAGHFWQRSIARIGSRATLAPATLAALARYDWPGNVRELQNVMASLAVSAPRRGSVGPSCLPAIVAHVEAGGEDLDTARRIFERRFVQAALARAGGRRSRAAATLGISRQGLAKLIARLGIDPQITSE